VEDNMERRRKGKEKEQEDEGEDEDEEEEEEEEEEEQERENQEMDEEAVDGYECVESDLEHNESEHEDEPEEEEEDVAKEVKKNKPKGPPYMCTFHDCNKSYATLHRYNEHLSKCHPADPQSLICEHCDKPFSSTASVRKHQQNSCPKVK
jgi:hypothetical protein